MFLPVTTIKSLELDVPKIAPEFIHPRLQLKDKLYILTRLYVPQDSKFLQVIAQKRLRRIWVLERVISQLGFPGGTKIVIAVRESQYFTCTTLQELAHRIPNYDICFVLQAKEQNELVFNNIFDAYTHVQKSVEVEVDVLSP